MMLRQPRTILPGPGSSQAAACITALVAALASLLPTDFHFISATYTQEDTDIAVGVATLPTDPTGVQDLADYSAVMRATVTNFHGKAGATRASVGVYGVFWNFSDPTGKAANGRVETTELAAIANAVAALNAGSQVTAINNFEADWQPYATVKIDDYWLKQVRRLYP